MSQVRRCDHEPYASSDWRYTRFGPLLGNGFAKLEIRITTQRWRKMKITKRNNVMWVAIAVASLLVACDVDVAEKGKCRTST